jgi:hypothetical protein
MGRGLGASTANLAQRLVRLGSPSTQMGSPFTKLGSRKGHLTAYLAESSSIWSEGRQFVGAHGGAPLRGCRF